LFAGEEKRDFVPSVTSLDVHLSSSPANRFEPTRIKRN